MKKTLKVFVAMLVLMLSTMLFACGKKGVECSVVMPNETTVVITVTKADTGAVLTDAMAELKSQGKLEYSTTGTMVSSISGKENKADYSSCWMLYTSDKEMSNEEWGTFEYDGKSYGSAILGADALEILTGETYIWVYVTF